jgi:hypothetical protein
MIENVAGKNNLLLALHLLALLQDQLHIKGGLPGQL